MKQAIVFFLLLLTVSVVSGCNHISNQDKSIKISDLAISKASIRDASENVGYATNQGEMFVIGLYPHPRHITIHSQKGSIRIKVTEQKTGGQPSRTKEHFTDAGSSMTLFGCGFFMQNSGVGNWSMDHVDDYNPSFFPFRPIKDKTGAGSITIVDLEHPHFVILKFNGDDEIDRRDPSYFLYTERGRVPIGDSSYFFKRGHSIGLVARRVSLQKYPGSQPQVPETYGAYAISTVPYDPDLYKSPSCAYYKP